MPDVSTGYIIFILLKCISIWNFFVSGHAILFRLWSGPRFPHGDRQVLPPHVNLVQASDAQLPAEEERRRGLHDRPAELHQRVPAQRLEKVLRQVGGAQRPGELPPRATRFILKEILSMQPEIWILSR